MSRFCMLVDTRLCVGCTDCVIACGTENRLPVGYCRSWIVEATRGRFPTTHVDLHSERCNQCDDPPCVGCCPTGASHVHDLGRVVLVTPEKCVGCKACLAACPYGARYIHPDGHADKCTFCTERAAEGRDPACVEVCPTRCLHFGDLDDPQSAVSRLLATRTHYTLKPEAGTQPRLFFLT